MNKRQIKLSCYLEQLNIEVVKVEMILNQLIMGKRTFY